jgi:hypothetical protein
VSDAPPPEPMIRDPAVEPGRGRGRGRGAVRASSFAIFVVAFLALAGAAVAAAWGQFKPGTTAPMVSIALSAAAVLLTLVALWLRPKR